MANIAAALHKTVMLLYTRQSFPVFIGYLLMVFFAKSWMRHTRPYDFRKLLIIYSSTCSILSAYSLYLFIAAYLAPSCTHLYQKSETPEFKYAFLIYHIIKWLELLDTVFMIVRHRVRQISFLHVYHHASMLLLSDLGYSGYPWPAISFYTGINSIIHIILYLYYALSAAFPDNPPQWKQLMTQLQILQFFIGFIFSGNGYLYHGFCIYGPIYGVTLTTLFCNFYYKAYIKKQRLPRKVDASVKNGISHEKSL